MIDTTEHEGRVPYRSGDYRNINHFLAGQPLGYRMLSTDETDNQITF